MPTKEQVKKALRLANNKASYDYFFKNLKSPEWLELLEAEGVFKVPPEAVEGKANTLSIPFWQPSKYLARVAGKKPEEVIEIIRSIAKTNNARIYEDFVDAAIAIPPEFSKKLIKILLKFLNNPFRFTYPSKLFELAIYFLERDCPSEAIKIADRLLDIKPSNNNYSGYENLFTNDWEYNEKLKMFHLKIHDYDVKLKFLNLLFIQLINCLKSDERNSRVEFTDYSCSWRQIIEKTNNLTEDLRDILINWICRLSEELITEKPEDFSVVIDNLLQQKFPIFIRIALYLLKNNLDKNEIIIKLLTDSKLAASIDVWHEYAVLLQKAYPQLKKADQNRILEFISKIVIEDVDKKEDRDQVNKRRQYRFYYIIKDYLKNDLKSAFEDLKNEFGDIKQPTYLIYHSSATFTDNSPISIEELNKKTADEVIDYIFKWKPTREDILGRSLEGLARVLTITIQQRPAEFISIIEKLKVNKSIILEAIINGFETAIANDTIVEWRPLLDFLLWSVSNQYVIQTDYIDDSNSGLSVVRDSACRLLVKAFSSKSNELTIEFKELACQIIAISLGDDDPSADREARGENHDDYYHLAINSTRGKALECAVQYGLWVMRKLNIQKGRSNLEFYKELFDVFDKHLDIGFEKSIAVHSIYGRWLPWLHLLDNGWTKNNINKIFPADKARINFRNAAWVAYLLYTEPYNEIFTLIRSEYLNAAILVNSENSKDKTTTRLIDEMMVFYLRGIVELECEIITELFEKNNSEILKHIISFVGRATPEHFKDRAIAVWEFILARCLRLEQLEPLIEFGWWAKLEFMEDTWILDQITIVLSKSKFIHPLHMVMDRLTKICESYPKRVAEILKIILENRIKEHGSYVWIDRAEPLIHLLMKSAAREDAISIVNKIALLGFTGYDKFLD